MAISNGWCISPGLVLGGAITTPGLKMEGIELFPDPGEGGYMKRTA